MRPAPGTAIVGAMRVAALVVGAGRGERLRASLAGRAGEAAPPGGGPEAVGGLESSGPGKAFVALAGRPLLVHSLEAVAASPAVDWVVPVVAHEALERAAAAIASLADTAKIAPPVAGGSERQESVEHGLAALPPEVELVAVHDAARPLVRPEDVTRVVEAAHRHGAALLAVPVSDTLKQVEAGVVRATPERAEHRAAQTPQVFRADWLREALAKARAEGVRATDDASLVERLGVAVHVVEGDRRNFKITTAEDLERAELALARRRSGSGEA